MPDPEPRYLNRELSWLEFNRRVLHQACDPRVPLLERARFVEIFGSNLDEFFMKRVGGLKRQVLAQVPSSGIKRLSPKDQLLEIRRRVVPLLDAQARCVTDVLLPELAADGIHLVRWEQLSAAEQSFAQRYFESRIFPVLTPLAVDPGHPFPFISNLSTSFGVLMKHPGADGQELFARVKIPKIFPLWIRVSPAGEEQSQRYLSLHELIGRHLRLLFPGLEIVDVMMFRVTRNADVDRDEEDAEDLLEMVAEELRERRFASVVRLEHGPKPNPRLLSILKEELEISDDDTYELPVYLEYLHLAQISVADRSNLKYPPLVPAPPPALADLEANIFEIIRQGDVLVHHPFESFSLSVERFLKSAASDPKVIAIKMTLYRTGIESPFIPLLIRAAEAGKQVACLVELKARFDEERNIQVAQLLEKAGVHVVYGIVGLKTHCKLALVVRQEAEGVRSYVHVGTGNYHAQTSLLYTDVGLFTAKPEFTEDVVHLFHYLTGRSLRWYYRKLLVAPIDMKTSFLRMIEREAHHVRSGRPGRIIAKMNSLEDSQIMDALYEASNQGVSIDLIVRGFCCLRPGVKGMSENIRVTSVVGRFLEHSRIFYFGNAADSPIAGEFFIGSADWMYRNLNNRVEAVAPVEDSALRARLWEILQLHLNDQRDAWDMNSDGTYSLRGWPPAKGVQDEPGAQMRLLQKTLQASAPEL